MSTTPTPAAPAAAPAGPTVYGVVTELLKSKLDMPADEIVAKVRARGINAPESTIRNTVYNVRSDLKKKAAAGSKPAAKATPKPAPKPAAKPAAKPAPKPATAVAKVAPKPAAKPATDLAGILGNVSLVNATIDVTGGVGNARKVAEAVRACGSVDAFLQHLDTVASIRSKK